MVRYRYSILFFIIYQCMVFISQLVAFNERVQKHIFYQNYIIETWAWNGENLELTLPEILWLKCFSRDTESFPVKILRTYSSLSVQNNTHKWRLVILIRMILIFKRYILRLLQHRIILWRSYQMTQRRTNVLSVSKNKQL